MKKNKIYLLILTLLSLSFFSFANDANNNSSSSYIKFGDIKINTLVNTQLMSNASIDGNRILTTSDLQITNSIGYLNQKITALETNVQNVASITNSIGYLNQKITALETNVQNVASITNSIDDNLYVLGSLANSGGMTYTNNSHADIGGLTYAKYSYAAGRFAVSISNHTDSFVWNGVVSSNKYFTHGPGTFNINPSNGVAGVYIGNETLKDIIKDIIIELDVSKSLVNVKVITYNENSNNIDIAQSTLKDIIDSLKTSAIGYAIDDYKECNNIEDLTNVCIMLEQNILKTKVKHKIIINNSYPKNIEELIDRINNLIISLKII